MDGLIPMVYKSLKRNNTRRHYQYLSSSSSSSQKITHTYNIADFYINENDHHHHDYFSRKYDDQYVISSPDKVSVPRGVHHRRYNSAHISGGGARGFGLDEDDSAAANPKQLVRFRSHKIFSCVTGA